MYEDSSQLDNPPCLSCNMDCSQRYLKVFAADFMRAVKPMDESENQVDHLKTSFLSMSLEINQSQGVIATKIAQIPAYQNSLPLKLIRLGM